jgi:predicted ATP-binding protein involved in virulence
MKSISLGVRIKMENKPPRPPKTVSKTIKNLEIKAKKKNVSAKFQLAQYWRDGNFVDDKDPEIANGYFSEVIEASKSFDFRFNKIRLFNFRRFEKLDLDMSDTNLTVIIGNNGSGKTSLLEGIAKSLSWFVNNFLREDTTGQKVVIKDICQTNEASFATIKSTIQYFQSNKCDVELTRPKTSNDEGLQGDYAAFKLLADMYRYLNEKIEDFNLPMIAYYPVERTQNQSQIQSSKIEKISSENWSSVDGYEVSLSSHQNFNRFLGWYKRLTFINLFDSSEYNKLKNKLDSNNGIISTIRQSISKESGSNKTIDDLIAQLTRDNEKISSQLDLLEKPANKLIEYINKSIMTFMPEITELTYEVEPEDGFFVKKSGVKLDAKQLSQGERTLIALVGDISRRLILLNPSLPNPLNGSGVILIDEIELHIHPVWQQNIIINLTETFPNIQFIITTHSPQVLSTVDVKSIRKLEEDRDGNIITSTPKYQTKGVTSADILAQIMGTDSVPNIKEAKDLTKLLSYIEQNQYEDTEAVALFELLRIHFGESHPEIQYCKNQIKLQKMKSKASELLKKKSRN